jgi:hypothetical protein
MDILWRFAIKSATRTDATETEAAIVEFPRTSACHGVYLAGITRMQRDLPLLPRAKVRPGDVLRLFGKPEDVARAAHLLGEAEVPGNVTDFVYLGGALVVGILIGMVTAPIAGASLSPGSPGALLSALGFGWLRSRRPTFGRFPSAAMQILEDPGLAVFIDLDPCRPLSAAYRTSHSLRCNCRSAGQHASDECDRSRRRKRRSGNRLHRALRDRERAAAPAGSHFVAAFAATHTIAT